jgi:ABC-type phosphate/phosphonate transport system permease subunit
MSSEQQPHRENSESAKPSSTIGIGELIQQRALHGLERANAKPYRSPRRIALTVVAVVIIMFLFLFVMDSGVKVMHRVIDIWAPVIFDTNKTEVKPTPKPKNDPDAAYMIKVVPSAQQSSASSQSASP